MPKGEQGGIKMAETKTAQPTLGTWDKLPATEIERTPKIDFEVNIPVTVIFHANAPREYQGDNGAYYVFDVSENGQNKAIITAAWTLLRALKILSPLQGKKITIVKKLVKGKQTFEVTEVK